MQNLIYAKPQQKRYSVERLRSLYTRLLRCIDINTDDLCPMGMEDDIDTQNVNTNSSSSNSYWGTIVMASYSSLRNLHPTTRVRDDNNISSDNDKRKSERNERKLQELNLAFRSIAASNRVFVNVPTAHSVDGDSVTDSSLVTVSDHALRTAHRLEATSIQIIYEIGDIVINAERPSSSQTSLRSDDVFAYFCEKAILPMLVEIMIEQPTPDPNPLYPSPDSVPLSPVGKESASSSFNGVAWSPKVKAQILRTVTLLLSKVRDRSAAYYLLSQHCMNQLMVHILPLSQWTEAAVQLLLPPFIDLLKILAMQLSGSPDLFPLYTIVRSQPSPNTTTTTIVTFPLFRTITQVTTSAYVQTDSYLYATCLNIVVGLLKISDVPIRTWITNCAEIEQQQLCCHLTQQSTEQYRRIVNMATGPIVDSERAKAMGIQLDTFNDQLDIYNDMFDCNIRTFNVRLCEMLLQELIHHIIQYLVPGPNQNFFQVGISDRDVVPLREARVQVSLLLLSRLFSNIDYKPFIRMLAVTLFHPKSTSLWESQDNVLGHNLMLSLNKIVQDESNDVNVPNLYRGATLKLLSGECGEWLVVGATALFENALFAIDNETFHKLHLLPNIVLAGKECPVPVYTLEESLSDYLVQNHEYKSIVSTMSLDCITSLAVKYIIKVATILHSSSGKDLRRFDIFYRTSKLMKAINKTRQYFFDQTLQSLHLHQVNDIIISFIESVVQTRYKSMISTPKRRTTMKQQKMYVYSLYPYGSTSYCKGSDPLIRKISGAKWNDIEVSRFNVTMALHLRAIHRILHRFHLQELRSHNPEQAAGPTSSSVAVPTSLEEFELIDGADELSSIFCCLQERPSIGSDLDLRGRMKFNFTVHGIKDESERDDRRTDRIRTLSEDMIFRETSDLILVLDAISIIVVRPIVPQQLERGVIICYVPLLDVIAAACDDIRLHIAVRYANVGCLIRNGNMIVTLDSPGTCLIVHQYLEKCRTLLREELYKKIVKLFSEDLPSTTTDSKSQLQQLRSDDLEIPQAKTF